MKELYTSMNIDPTTSQVIEGAGQLAALGVRAGGVLLVHSSLKAARPAAGCIEHVVAALARSLGDSGTLLIPALSFDEVTQASPVFDRQLTPSCIGAIPEFFRQLAATERSEHPTHSVSGFGAAAGEILASHHMDTTPVGAHSPFRAVRDRRGQILMLGCGLRPNTSMHGVEEVAEAPYIFGGPITYTIHDGPKTRVKDHQRHGFNDLEQRYDRITEVLEPPALRHGTVFGAECWLIEGAALWETGAAMIRKDPYYFVEKTG
jgi:aminoglycoside 3-N-acetyltransferase